MAARRAGRPFDAAAALRQDAALPAAGGQTDSQEAGEAAAAPITSDSPPDPPALLESVRAAQVTGDHALVVATVARMRLQDGRADPAAVAQACLASARANLALGQLSRAREECTAMLQAPALPPSDRLAGLLLRGQILEQREEYKLALSDFEAARSIDPGNTAVALAADRLRRMVRANP